MEKITKLIKSRAEVEDKIHNAVKLIVDPVVATLSPFGRNTLYEDSHGGINQTNDGVTIAKQIQSSDPVEQAVISTIRQAALATNAIAGDGTTTTTGLSGVMTTGGLKLVQDGMNPIKLAKAFKEFGDKIISRLNPIKVETDADLLNIATISSNNDSEIAAHVVDIVKTAGETGQVLIEMHNKEKTELEKDTGFIVQGGIISPEYAQNQGMNAAFEDCHVLVCDKRIYYEEEAETILRLAIENGIERLVIVARDFIGKSVNVFSANHQKNPAIKLMLIKDENAKDGSSALTDLAVYLGGNLITEKTGKLVDNMKVDDFCHAKKVYANPQRTVLVSGVETNEPLKERIKALEEAKDKDPDDKEVQRRLAALTTGMVTVHVGGQTMIEIQEKIFRYEDAINATRSAMKYGYLPGGGTALYGAFIPDEHPQELIPLFRKFCEWSIRQIARNCAQHEETVLAGVRPVMGVGYNAKTNTHEDMVASGVIDPYQVLELAIKNAISVANVIITTEYYIVNKKEDNGKTD